jgi:hypothetical protein
MPRLGVEALRGASRRGDGDDRVMLLAMAEQAGTGSGTGTGSGSANLTHVFRRATTTQPSMASSVVRDRRWEIAFHRLREFIGSMGSSRSWVRGFVGSWGSWQSDCVMVQIRLMFRDQFTHLYVPSGLPNTTIVATAGTPAGILRKGSRAHSGISWLIGILRKLFPSLCRSSLFALSPLTLSP